MISRPQDALLAAAAVARAAGVTPILLGDAIEGEAREVARVMAGIARSCADHGYPAPGPCVLLSGRGNLRDGPGPGARRAERRISPGAGGGARRQSRASRRWPGTLTGSTARKTMPGPSWGRRACSRAAALGVHAKALLADNDGYTFFQALNDLVMTGPTLTNVNDFRAILVEPG